MKSRYLLVMIAVTVAMGISSADVTASGSVSFWTQWATSTWLPEAVKDFTEATRIGVELRSIGWGTEELFVAAAGGVLPDLYSHGHGALSSFGSQNLMRPLDSVVAKWKSYERIIPALLDSLRYEGKLVALPAPGVSVRDLVYRADIFANVGLDPDHPPRSWDDLVSHGRRLVEIDGEGNWLRAALKLSDRQMFYLFMWQNGQKSIFNGQGGPQLDTEESVGALTFLVDMIHAHQIAPSRGFGTTSGGTAAMEWTSGHPFTLGQPGHEQMRAATFPYSKQPATWVAADWVALSTQATNPDAALALLEFLFHPNTQYKIQSVNGNIPIFRDALHWDFIKNTPEVPHFMLALENAVWTEAHPLLFEYRDHVTKAVVSAMDERVPPLNALVTANEIIRNIVKK